MTVSSGVITPKVGGSLMPKSDNSQKQLKA